VAETDAGTGELSPESMKVQLPVVFFERALLTVKQGRI